MLTPTLTYHPHLTRWPLSRRAGAYGFGESTTTALGSSPTLSATAIGEYKVTVSGADNRTCVAYLTLSKSLCNTVVQTYQCGTTPATPISSIDTTPLTNLAPGDTIRTGDFDVVVTEVIGGGASGWIGKGYTEIPYLKNQRIAVELNSAVVNDCYELVSGTVVSAYDPAWGGVRSVDMAIDQIRDLATRLVDLYNTYTGTAEQQAQIRQANAQLCENITSNNELSADQKATLLAKCQAYQADAETFLTCTAPAPTTSGVGNRNTARSATSASCTVTADMLTGQVNDIQQAASANATATPPKSKPNEYFSATGELLKPLVFFAVGDKKVVDLPKGAKLDIRMVDQSIFDRNANRLMSFQEVTKKYYADPLKSSSDAIQYIAEGDKTLYPLRAFSTALPEVFTVTYRIDPQGGCKAEVFKTKLTAEGQIDGPKASVWVATSDCGQTDEFLAKYGQGLKTILAANNQRADVYLYDCAKPNKYVHVTATKSETLTGSATTDRPGEANILVRACWNSTTKSWVTVKTEFRVQPVVNDALAAKGVSTAMVNDVFDRKANEILTQRSKETSPGEGTNTNYSNLLTDPAEGKFEYKNSNIFAFIVGLKDISGKLIELAKVPESTWNPQAQGYTESVVKVPAILAGGTDQVLEELTDGLQFVDLALDIAAEPAKAKQIWDGIRQINPDMVKGMIAKHVQIYQQGGPKAWYQGGRDGVTIATAWKGLATAVTKAASMVSTAGATVLAIGSTVRKEIVDLLVSLKAKFGNDVVAYQAFLSDFARNDAEAILRRFNAPSTDPSALDVDAWRVLKDAGKRDLKLRPDALQKVTQLLADPKVRQALGANYVEELTKICDSYKGFDNAKSLVDHLEDVRLFCNRYIGKEGFNDMIATLKNPNKNVQDGMQHTLTQLNRADFDADNVRRFDMAFIEEGFDCPRQQCKFDVEMNGDTPRFFEFKSYKDAARIPTNQFMAYISRIDNLNELQYVFNAKKLSETAAREGMINFIKANRETVFANMNSKLRDDLKIDLITELTDNKLNEMVLKFVFSR